MQKVLFRYVTRSMIGVTLEWGCTTLKICAHPFSIEGSKKYAFLALHRVFVNMTNHVLLNVTSRLFT